MRMMAHFAAVIAAALLVGGCAKSKAVTTAEYRGALPVPDMIIVYNFATTPAEAKWAAGKYMSVPPTPSELAQVQAERLAGQTASDALANELVSQLQQMGLMAMRSAFGVPVDGNILLIQGQFQSISESQKSIGVKGSNVMASVQIYETVAAGRQLVEQIETDSNSDFQGKVKDDARRIAQDIARRIGKLYQQKGWTLPGMMP